MSSISKQLKLSQQYTYHCFRETAVSLLGECSFEARHILRVSGNLRATFARNQSHALSSVCSVEIFESTSTAIVAMHEQTSENSLGRNTVANSPVTIQNFTSHSQKTVNFNEGAFSGVNVTINIYNSNDFVFVIEVIKAYFNFSCTSKHLSFSRIDDCE